MTTQTSTKATHQTTVAIEGPPEIGDLVTFVHDVITKLTNNPTFPNLAATIAALQAALTDLQTAADAAPKNACILREAS